MILILASKQIARGKTRSFDTPQKSWRSTGKLMRDSTGPRKAGPRKTGARKTGLRPTGVGNKSAKISSFVIAAVADQSKAPCNGEATPSRARLLRLFEPRNDGLPLIFCAYW